MKTMQTMQKMTSMFLSQSYSDAWEDYERSLHRPGFPVWDYVVLTASNEQQADGFAEQIKERQKRGLLPARTRFSVLPDPEGKRVGSGGATLGVLRYIAAQEGRADFSGLRILVIHSGGDSKRAPQYSALGKLFSPVPHELKNGRPSTLFDEFMISAATLPARVHEGMLLLSGDVLLLFNPLLVDYSGKGAAAISFKEPTAVGKNHGVFLRGEDGNVRRCLQKQSEEALRGWGAVNEQGCVDIDTGAVIFSKEMLASLYRLIEDKKSGGVTEESFARLVNERVRLSLYADFLYPLGSDASLEDFYKEKPEGTMCEALVSARKEVWEALRPYRMKLLRLAPARFIHFGTSREILELMSRGVAEYEGLGWSRHVNTSFEGMTAGYNSVLSERADCGEECYLENSYVHGGAKIGDRVILSYIDLHAGREVPSDVVLHGLKQKDGRFVARVYGITDNPKGGAEEPFLQSSLAAFMKEQKLSEAELWDDGDEKTIWTARLYPCCKNIDEAVDAALNLYSLMQGAGDICAWKNAERKSLRSGFWEADGRAILQWDSRMGDLVRMNRIKKLIEEKQPARKAAALLNANRLTPIQQQWMEDALQKADFSERIRLYYYIGTALGDEQMLLKSFQTVSDALQKAVSEQLGENKACKIAKEEHRVALPLRVNWGGGWSDTPPYCNELGGTVLNAAIRLNGKYPVEVTLKKIAERKIIFDSRDMDVHGEFADLQELQKTGDPYDPFALQKAALLACGIIPKEGGSLPALLERLGGGFEMHSEVTGVPKGSGLGTSSILAAACAKALLEFTGQQPSESALYSTVLVMEQIMSTGGGWQDQVGGVAEGIKLITSAPGLVQKIKAEKLALSEATRKELNERFCLIYTGQRRLARNLLRDVVGRYIGSEPEAISAIGEMQRLAERMRLALEGGEVDAFAGLLSEHWEQSKRLDGESTNTLIDWIFESVDDLIDGKMICGAGGGGFLQCIAKKGVSAEQIQKRLTEVFMDSEIRVWNCELI